MHLYLTRHTWHQHEGVYACGFCYGGNGRVLSGPDLAMHFASASDEASLFRLLKAVNGQFAVIVDREGFRAAAVDRTRTIPLFYSDGGLADQPYSLPRNGDIDNMALLQYRASGNTFAGKTLYKDIRQVPAAAMVCWRNSGVQTLQYWTLLCRHDDERTATVEEVDECLHEVFQRTVENIGKRPVAIPLSGGYDSRLIAVMLKQHGITDALCYHIGHPGSDEERYAREAAEKLGFKYIFLDGEKLAAENTASLDDTDFCNYYQYVGDYTNFVWLYEYYGLKRMFSAGYIAPDTVFLPGHSGDFIAGSHLRKGCISPRSSTNALATSIVLRSFEYRAGVRVAKEVRDYFKKELAGGHTAVSAYQWFIMQNRQAQQIVNSTKVYGFFGHQVLLPLWDNSLVDLFRTLPYKQLIDCTLYTDCVKRIFSKAGLSTERAGGGGRPAKLPRLAIKRMLPKAVANRMVSIGDETGEYAMCQPMLRELVDTGCYPSARHFTSSNEIIKDWYELKALRRQSRNGCQARCTAKACGGDSF